MAYVAADAIVQRLRELVQDGGGTYRAIAAARFTGGLLQGMELDEARRRGLYTEKPVEIRLDSLSPHPQRLTDAGSIQIHLVGVTIRVVRTLAVSEQVDDALLDDVRALAIEDGSALADVMSWPNNLKTTTLGSVATGIKGAQYRGSTARVSGTVGETMDIATEHRFDLTVTSTPATS